MRSIAERLSYESRTSSLKRLILLAAHIFGIRIDWDVNQFLKILKPSTNWTRYSHIELLAVTDEKHRLRSIECKITEQLPHHGDPILPM